MNKKATEPETLLHHTENLASEIRATDSINRNASKFNAKMQFFILQMELSRKHEQNVREEKRFHRIIVVSVAVGALLIIASYFFILIYSGINTNNFEISSIVLSSLGISTIGGSIALIGFVLSGIFVRRSHSDVNLSADLISQQQSELDEFINSHNNNLTEYSSWAKNFSSKK